jgi:hypothetical protein
MSVLVLGEIRHGIEVLRRRGDSKQADVFGAWLDDSSRSSPTVSS